ncbi:MAG: ABC transporter substrate-binding protein [Burkholderiaceae bacterium]|nr:ABC transporter substrate-binding protein [Burkholderiaceae bacterium]
MTSFTRAACLTLLALAASQLAHADDKIVLMVGGVEKQIYLPAKLTEQLGYFKEQGLDVELQSEPSGVNAEDELLAGAAQGVVGFYDHTIDLQAKGKAVESVVQFSQAPGEIELVSSKLAAQIKSPADFKGKTLGVTGLGSSTNFLTQFLAIQAGVKNSEFTTLPVGSGTTFIAAIKQGKIDAGMTTEPTASRLVKTGDAVVLLNMCSPEVTQKALGGLYPAASLYMQTSWVNSHKPQVQKLANAFVKTMKFIQTHSAEEIAQHMPADYYAGDKAAYVVALNNSKPMFTADGVMPASGPATVLKVLLAFDKTVQGKTIDLSKTFTTVFVSAAK